MISIEDKGLTILVCDDSFSFDKYGVLESLLGHLEYSVPVDFRLRFSTGNIIGYQSELIPKDDANILKAIKELEDACSNINELEDIDEEVELSFELLLLK